MWQLYKYFWTPSKIWWRSFVNGFYLGGEEMKKQMKIYHVETQEDYDDLMIKLEEQGYRWLTGEKLSSANGWNGSEEETSIHLNKYKDYTVTHGFISTARENNPDIPIIKHKAKGVKQMEKVVVPQYVADWYEKYSNNSLGFKISELSHVSKRMEQWINSLETDYRCGMEIVQEVIAKMHLYGYEVEEEKKYYWRKKKEHLFEFELLELSYLRIHRETKGLMFGAAAESNQYQVLLTETQVRQAVSEEDFNKLEKVENE